MSEKQLKLENNCIRFKFLKNWLLSRKNNFKNLLKTDINYYYYFLRQIIFKRVQSIKFLNITMFLRCYFFIANM